jgi:hypothetical protein
MQYDLDTRSEHAELFLYLRSIILSFDEIKEIKNTKQTSYKDGYSTVCMMRVRKGVVHLSFANGAKMQEMFSELLGEAKIVRYLKFTTVDEIRSERLKAMLQESQLINMEKYELRKLRCDALKTLS